MISALSNCLVYKVCCVLRTLLGFLQGHMATKVLRNTATELLRNMATDHPGKGPWTNMDTEVQEHGH